MFINNYPYSCKQIKLFKLSLQRLSSEYKILNQHIINNITLYNYSYINTNNMLHLNTYDTFYVCNLLENAQKQNILVIPLFGIWFEYDINYDIFNLV